MCASFSHPFLRYFSGVLNKAVIPLTLIGLGIVIANSVFICASLAIDKSRIQRALVEQLLNILWVTRSELQ